MSHGFEAPRSPVVDQPPPPLLRPIDRLIGVINRALLGLGMLALLAASLILTHSVVSRYFFKAATDWQDEAAVFCLVGAAFLCSAYVQSMRGHIGIEAMASWLSPGVDRVRRVMIDVLSCIFCAFFAWKSWTLWHESWAEGQTTSSSWAPPLWIPYALMASGMTLLAVQLLLQVVARTTPTKVSS